MKKKDKGEREEWDGIGIYADQVYIGTVGKKESSFASQN